MTNSLRLGLLLSFVSMIGVGGAAPSALARSGSSKHRQCENAFLPTNPLIPHTKATIRSLSGPSPYGEINETHYGPALKAAIAKLEETVFAVEALTEQPSFTNTANPVLNAAALYERLQGNVRVMHDLGVGGVVLEDAKKLSDTLEVKFSELFLQRPVLIRRLKGLLGQPDAKLSEDERFILNDWVQKAEGNGVLLAEATKARLQSVDTEIAKKISEFGERFLKAQSQTLLLDIATQFAPGMPEVFLAAAKKRAEEKGQSGYAIELRPAAIDQFMPVLEYALDPEVRRQVYVAFRDRAKGTFDNRELNREIANLRLERAQLLGFKTYADSVISSSMVGSVAAIQDFVREVKPEFQKMLEQELKALAAIKARETGNSQLDPWDVQFYAKKHEIETLNWDVAELTPYLEFERTLSTSLDIIGRIYGLSFEQDKNVQTWHPDVRAFVVKDKANGKRLGLIYLDLLPRPGKLSSAFAHELKAPGLYQTADGRTYWQEGHALASMSLVRGPDGKVYFSARNLQSLFHEVGHTVHFLDYDKGIPMYSSSHAARDFVELPSQLLEHWVYKPEVMRELARHHQTGAPIPEEWLTKIIDSRRLNIAMKSFARRNLMIEVDLGWHTITRPITEDVETFEARVLSDWRVFPYLMDIAGSGTINTYLFYNGYQGFFHGYQFAESMDADVKERFLERQLFDTRVGRRFRREVLAPGALAQPATLYQRFQGRPVNVRAILNRMD